MTLDEYNAYAGTAPIESTDAPREFLGTFPETSGNLPGNFRELSRELPENISGTRLTSKRIDWASTTWLDSN